jgi:hypothetical protein
MSEGEALLLSWWLKSSSITKTDAWSSRLYTQLRERMFFSVEPVEGGNRQCVSDRGFVKESKIDQKGGEGNEKTRG